MVNNYGLVSFSRPSESSGFFSNYFTVLSSMKEALDVNLLPFVDTSKSWFNPTCDFENDTVIDSSINPWDWWFVQNKEGALAKSIGICRDHIIHNPRYFVEQPNLPYFREVAQKYCIIQPHILHEEEILFDGLIKGKTTLGVLARGTEMLQHHLEYPKIAAQEWPKVLKFCLDQHPDIDNIFLVSDDGEIIESLISAFPQIRFIPHFFRSTVQTREAFKNAKEPWWLHSLTGDMSHRRRLGEECLIQARLLSRCDYFLGAHSGVTNAAHFFRNGPFKHSYTA